MQHCEQLDEESELQLHTLILVSQICIILSVGDAFKCRENSTTVENFVGSLLNCRHGKELFTRVMYNIYQYLPLC